MANREAFQETRIAAGISMFKCVRNESNKIIDLEWNFYSPIDKTSNGVNLIGKRFLREMHGEKFNYLFQKLLNVAETGKPLEFIYLEEEEEKWYSVTAVRKEDELIVSYNDVSELKTNEEAFRQSENLYRVITDNSTDLVVRADLEGRFLYVSPSSLKLMGYEPSELEGKSYYDFLHPENAKHLPALRDIFFQKHDIITTRFKLRTKEGEYKWFEATSKGIRDEKGQLIEVQSSIRDIEDRKKIEKQLRKSEAMYRFLAENSGDEITRTDPLGKFIYASPAIKKIKGYEPEEVLGTSFLDYVHPEDLPEVARVYQSLLKKPVVITVSMRFKTKEGKYKWIEATATTIVDAVGNVIEVQASTRDISQRKQAEEELERLNRELEVRVQKRTEELEKNQQLLRVITDSIPALISYLDTDLRLRFINKTHITWFGHEVEKDLGRPFEEIVRQYGQKETLGRFRESLKGSSEYYEHEVVDLKGQRRFLKFAMIPHKEEDGQTLGYITISLDITKEKQAQQEAKFATDQLLSIVNNIPVIFWAVDKEGMLTISEGQSLEELGQKPGELVGHSAYILYKDYPDILNNIRRALKGEAFNISMKVAHVYFQSYYHPIKDENGEITGMAGISLDISDRIRMEEAVVASEAKYKAMAEGIPQLVWTALPDGSMDYYNQNWYNYTGIKAGENVEKAWEQVIHPSDLGPALDKWKESLQTGSEYYFANRIRRAADGQYRWHLVKAWPTKSKKGEIFKWLGTCTDIHDQKEQYEELQLKNRELVRTNTDLDNFVYTASHDLKAPISNMEGLFSAIKSDVSNECEQDIHFMLNMAGDSLQRLKRTISELTEISQIQRNFNEDLDVIDINTVVEEFKVENESRIKATQALLITDLKVSKLPFSRGNFRSLLYNLLSNAIKFQHPERPPRIEITSQKVSDNCILLKVTDNGIGFEPGQKDKIFRMFKRLHSHVEGTGVGLYLVKRVMENSGGKIDVESEPGKGTTFKLFFNIPAGVNDKQKNQTAHP